MKENLTTKVYFSTDEALARTDLHYAAEEQLGVLLNDMEFNDLDYGTSINVLDDGTRIEIVHSFGQSVIDIIAPEEQKGFGNILFEVRQRGRFYVEIKDPLYNPWPESEEHPGGRKDSSHFLYWMFEKGRFEDIVEGIIILSLEGDITDALVREAKISAYAELSSQGALIGQKIVLVPFDFIDIEHLFPKDDFFGRRMTRTAKHLFREAKAFDTAKVQGIFDSSTKGHSYVGYCNGGLLDRDTETFIYNGVEGLIEYTQFHIINEYLIWFGELKRKEAIGYSFNISCRTMKVSEEGLQFLGSFYHWDWRGYQGTDHHRAELTEDPGWGNVIRNTTPGLGVHGVYNVDEVGVVLMLPYCTDKGFEFYYAEDPEIGGEFGAFMKLYYTHDGQHVDRNGVLQTMNYRGEIVITYEGLLWGSTHSVLNDNISMSAETNTYESESDDEYPFNDDDIPLQTVNASATCYQLLIKNSQVVTQNNRMQIAPSGNKTGAVSLTFYKDITSLGGLQHLGSCALAIQSQLISAGDFYWQALEDQFAYQTVGVWNNNRCVHPYAEGWIKQRAYVSKNCWPPGHWSCPLCSEVPNGTTLRVDNFGKPWCYVKSEDPDQHSVDNLTLRIRDYNSTLVTWEGGTTCEQWYDTLIGFRSLFCGDPSGVGVTILSNSHSVSMDKNDCVTWDGHNVLNIPKDFLEQRSLLTSSGYTSGLVLDQDGTNEHQRGLANGYAKRLRYGYTPNPHIFVSFALGAFWSKEAFISTENNLLIDKGYYTPRYAFMDNRAEDDVVFCFVGSSRDYSSTVNDMPIDDWDILMYDPDRKSISEVKTEFFDLLDISDNSEIISMGMF